MLEFSGIELALIETERPRTSHDKISSGTSLDDQDANLFYQLKAMSEKFYKKLLNADNGNQGPLQITKGSVNVDEEEGYKGALCTNVHVVLKERLLDMMKKSLSACTQYSCLNDEMYAHLCQSQMVLKYSFGYATEVQTVKAYLQGQSHLHNKFNSL